MFRGLPFDPHSAMIRGVFDQGWGNTRISTMRIKKIT